MPAADRIVSWPGFINARDLGGLRSAGGDVVVRPGAVVRSASVHAVTADGWASARAAGIRSVVDLRDDDEIAQDPVSSAPPSAIPVLPVALDDSTDREFWDRMDADGLDGTPLYLRPFLDEKPERCVAAMRAVLTAPAGGILVHCVAGRDRTGLVSLLLLGLAGVSPDEIADDYLLSDTPLEEHFAANDRPSQRAAIERAVATHGTTVRAAMVQLASTLEVGDYLRRAGMSPAELDGLRARLGS
jgi:protein tyrosine/serine phosphatase